MNPSKVESCCDSDAPSSPFTFAVVSGQVGLLDWIGANSALIESALCERGAIWFRNFGVTAVEDFEQISASVLRDVYKENSEHTPITENGVVQRPVPYSPVHELLWHNENIFNHRWPTRIVFCCQEAAENGGETTLVDTRSMFRALGGGITSKFASKNVRYIRRYGGIGLDWRKIFRAQSRNAVEASCREAGMDFTWEPDGSLSTSAIRPGIVRSKATRDLCWFNQIQHWHPAALPSSLRQALEGTGGTLALPRHCSFGDRTAIRDETVATILAAYRELEYSVRLATGDVLMVDNVLMAHGRKAFSGRRQILVAMGDMASYKGTCDDYSIG